MNFPSIIYQNGAFCKIEVKFKVKPDPGKTLGCGK